jgi:hypothetical protein
MKYARVVLWMMMIFSFEGLAAQNTGFVAGYLVTNEGDTLRGMIKYRNEIPYRVLEKIKYRKTAEGKDTDYSPDQVRFFMLGNTLYVSKLTSATGSPKKLFLETVISGYLSYYKFEYTESGAGNRTQYVILEKKGDRTQLFYILNSVDFSFKKEMTEYLKDAPPVCEKIIKGTYRQRHIEEITEAYNTYVTN